MSRRRNYSEATLAIMDRYFQALDYCLETKRLKTITAYCEEYNIDKRHLYAQRADRHKGFFEVGWLKTLIDGCSVSSQWFLTGAGNIISTPK